MAHADLHDYLQTLISPPEATGKPRATVLTSWEEFDPTVQYTGLVIHGFTPTEEQTAALYEALLPGAHICLFAPEDQPTGHTGAIRLEDVGFEIRDAILWVRGPGALHYVAKAARSEREAGCAQLPARKGFEAVEREEGSAGVNNPRAGAGRTADNVRNFHPCVKPKAVMVRLLETVPTDQGPVLDPFMGSGSTLLACLETGHDAIGIEREEEYLRIADARVRHWDRQGPRWEGAEIQSDLPPSETIAAAGEEEDLFDLFDN